MDNDTLESEEDGHEDAQDLAVHDHDLPVIVVTLIAIIEESELLFDILSVELI